MSAHHIKFENLFVKFVENLSAASEVIGRISVKASAVEIPYEIQTFEEVPIRAIAGAHLSHTKLLIFIKSSLKEEGAVKKVVLVAIKAVIIIEIL